ncbi:redoxin [Bacteriovorax sp. BSW11_IV]|uniref:redoxin domain-containing protein n=1 Tax=Bacteriovorax sp. BSW11_IV TaxID=1353529 RepID=UPI000389E4C8|nr:redoxin domain-containing protein [Bacteriovorax sp. BSW11_IV]EQC44515.1 redoxin [Bacteriovorax sp. BSW11_IV]
MLKFTFFILFLFINFSWASTATKFEVVNLENLKIETLQIGVKNTVIFFSSIDCPCSDSHLSHFVDLKKQFPEITFVGINENGKERIDEIRSYYQNKNLNFPIFLDKDFKVADALGAVKTPHVYLLDKEGKIIYHGGVTNSSNFNSATTFYLQEVLNDISKGQKPRRDFARALGCYIAR